MNTQYAFKKSSQKTVALYTLLYRSRWHGVKLSCTCSGTRAHAHAHIKLGGVSLNSEVGALSAST